jgi:hypothetical protein
VRCAAYMESGGEGVGRLGGSGLCCALAGHTSRPPCLDEPPRLGCAMPSPAGLSGSLGMTRSGPRAGTAQQPSCPT